MPVQRCVCAENAHHYSSTPDLATLRCPICDAPVVREVLPDDEEGGSSDDG